MTQEKTAARPLVVLSVCLVVISGCSIAAHKRITDAQGEQCENGSLVGCTVGLGLILATAPTAIAGEVLTGGERPTASEPPAEQAAQPGGYQFIHEPDRRWKYEADYGGYYFDQNSCIFDRDTNEVSICGEAALAVPRDKWEWRCNDRRQCSPYWKAERAEGAVPPPRQVARSQSRPEYGAPPRANDDGYESVYMKNCVPAAKERFHQDGGSFCACTFDQILENAAPSRDASEDEFLGWVHACGHTLHWSDGLKEEYQLAFANGAMASGAPPQEAYATSECVMRRLSGRFNPGEFLVLATAYNDPRYEKEATQLFMETVDGCTNPL